MLISKPRVHYMKIVNIFANYNLNDIICIFSVIHFEKNVLVTKDNTPSLPLKDAHLEGFFISNPILNG
jgi:hypothetical protein